MSPVIIPGQFGFGTMSMTWTPNPVPMDSAIETMKYTVEKYNVRFLNGGDFYGPDNINLKYIGEFWQRYSKQFPDLIVSIKGAIDAATFAPKGDKETIDKSIENLASFFPSDKAQRPKLIFQVARVDKSVPYKDTIGFIQAWVEKGVIDGISLSEVGISSIVEASEVAPISCVELELSLMTQDILQNGILKELSKRNIQVIAYSPLCRGFLTERTADDFDSFYELCHRPGDIRGYVDKFSVEHYASNCKVVTKLQEYAHQKKTTLEAFALSWILAVSECKDFCGIEKISKIMPIPSGSTPAKVDSNLGSIIKLTKEDLDDIKLITDSYKVKGYRYTAEIDHTLNG